MRTRSFLCALCALFAFVALAAPTQAQVCTGDRIVGSQATLDAFDCTVLNGNLTIGGFPMTSSEPFSGLTEVTGYLHFNLMADGTDFTGFRSLQAVGGDLRFRLGTVSDISGFGSLDSVGGSLVFDENTSLTTLDAFDALTSLGGLVFDQTRPLQTLGGFGSLTSISGDLSLYKTSFQDLSALQSIETIDGTVSFVGNGGLTDFTGLSGLRTVGGSFGAGGRFENSGAVTPGNGNADFSGLANLETVGGTFSVTYDAGDKSFAGLDNLRSIGGFFFQNNEGWTTIDGFPALETITGGFTLHQRRQEPSRDDLTTISGFRNVRTIGGGIAIDFARVLSSITGFGSLEDVGSSVGIAQTRLPDLDWLRGLERIGGSLSIGSNQALVHVDGLASLRLIEGSSFPLTVANNPSLIRCSVGLGPILYAESVDPGDGEAIAGGPSITLGNIFGQPSPPTGDCQSGATILDAYEPPSPIELAASVAYGTCAAPPALFPAGRSRCFPQVTGTNLSPDGRRFTVFIRLDGPGGFSDVRFRGEIKPQGNQTVTSRVPLTSKATDPAGDYTATILAELGSVAEPSAAAVELASLPFTKAGGAGLRRAEPLSVWPNPSAGAATVRFALAEASEAAVAVYDALGREVARPVSGDAEGAVEVALPDGLAPGVYVARLVAGGRTETVRFTVTR